jgi:mono/diheme cytochrome c family protein
MMNQSMNKNSSRFFGLALLAVGVMASIGCTGSGETKLSKEPNIEIIQDMMDSPAMKAQDYVTGDINQAAARIPPANTVPVGHKVYPYHLDPAAAERGLKNPLSGQMSPEVLQMGQKRYETYCAVCHGYEGKGDGPVAPKMALKPPPVVSEKVTAFSDARIYHIIVDGQGVMSSYAYQLVDERDRWAIVNYVRSLQRLSRSGKSGSAPQGQ